MNSSAKTKPLIWLRYCIVIGLAGFLITYHGLVLFKFYAGSDPDNQTALLHAQSAIRLFIILSLFSVIFRVRNALWGMWLGIIGLVATQYWAHFTSLNIDAEHVRHALSYLRGLVFPTLITILRPRTTDL